jgi:hypothetical protein
VLFAGVSGHVPQGLTGEPDDHSSVAFQEYVDAEQLASEATLL